MQRGRPMIVGLCVGLFICVTLWSKSDSNMQIAPLEGYIQKSAEPPYVTIAQLQTTQQQPQQQQPLLLQLLQQQQQQNQQLINDTNKLVAATTLGYLPSNDDFINLIDLKNFEFLINHQLCDDATPLVVILIHSAPTNYDKRKTIRDTWGYNDERSRILFFLGAVSNARVQNKIISENEKYNDIVQGNFIDSYKNLTYKHVTALKWFTYYCPNAKYVLKTDDDVFVNTPSIYTKMDQGILPRADLIFCRVMRNVMVRRTYRSKWYVSPREYRPRYFPTYCPGFAIFYSADVAQKLYWESQKLPYFWIDDVHITGTVAKSSNLTIVPTTPGFMFPRDMAGLTKTKLSTFLIAPPNLKETEIRDLWNLVQVPVNER